MKNLFKTSPNRTALGLLNRGLFFINASFIKDFSSLEFLTQVISTKDFSFALFIANCVTHKAVEFDNYINSPDEGFLFTLEQINCLYAQGLFISIFHEIARDPNTLSLSDLELDEVIASKLMNATSSFQLALDSLLPK